LTDGRGLVLAVQDTPARDYRTTVGQRTLPAEHAGGLAADAPTRSIPARPTDDPAVPQPGLAIPNIRSSVGGGQADPWRARLVAARARHPSNGGAPPRYL